MPVAIRKDLTPISMPVAIRKENNAKLKRKRSLVEVL